MIWKSRTKGSANILNVAPLPLEDRLAGGDRMLLRARPIEMGWQSTLFEFMVPGVLPMLAGLFATVFVLSAGSRVISLPQAAWTSIGLVCLVGGWLVGGRVSGRLRSNYRRGLQQRVQPSAVVDSTGIELILPEVGTQRVEWSEVTGLALRGPSLGKKRCELLGQNGEALAVVPWALMLPEGEYQLGDYMVAAAPRRLAAAPISRVLPGYPGQTLGGPPSRLACVTLAPRALENSPAAEG